MTEQNQNEEPVFKVADRRKFNLDGSLREGVSIEESAAQTAQTSTNQNAASSSGGNKNASQITAATPSATPEQAANAFHTTDAKLLNNFASDLSDEVASGDADEITDETEIPGADNPASFANFVISLASQTAAALGMAEEPTTGQVRVNLQSGKYLIDVLGMLAEKTSGNLHPLEQKLFNQLLGELRMQYVQIERLAQEQRRRQEDQLLKQAQQKFSGKDILGK